GRGSPVACRRADAAAQGSLARQADRARGAYDAEIPRNRGLVPRNAGFVCSDDVYAGEKTNLIGSFNRCDRSDTYVDHHVFFCLNHPKTGLNHLSFEVPDIDDVAIGHDYLAQFDTYEHMWGIGRHVLGSQVYDYWADPWGRVHEHWADSDRLNLANGSKLVPAEEGLVSQWGEAPPKKFIDHASP